MDHQVTVTALASCSSLITSRYFKLGRLLERGPLIFLVLSWGFSSALAKVSYTPGPFEMGELRC